MSNPTHIGSILMQQVLPALGVAIKREESGEYEVHVGGRKLEQVPEAADVVPPGQMPLPFNKESKSYE